MNAGRALNYINGDKRNGEEKTVCAKALWQKRASCHLKRKHHNWSEKSTEDVTDDIRE